MQRIALTSGEPAGIGPDLCIMLAQQARDYELIVIGDPATLRDRAAMLKLPLRVREFDVAISAQADAAGELCVLPVKSSTTVTAAQLDKHNAQYVLDTLDAAMDLCIKQQVSAMVTAPIHKGIINDAGIAFTGHTEYLAKATNSTPVMLLAAGDFRVALVTTHLPLAEVPAAITEKQIMGVMQVLHAELKTRFGIESPHILVCGLNPHAGEDGHMGREEIDVISPTLNKLRDKGLRIIGPLPADTLFTPQHLEHADAAVAMFHDQGLPVLKYAGFGKAVNITLGLPIIRTSVDHGTALDKAGTGAINDGSLRAAIDMALLMSAHSHLPAAHPS